MSCPRTVLSAAAATVALTYALAGCGSSSSGASSTPTASAVASVASTATSGMSESGMASPAMSESGMASPAMSGSEMASPAMSGSGMASPAMSAAAGTLTAVSQTSTGRTVTVADVTLAGAAQGWVAVHIDVAGKPGPVVGEAQVKKGDNKNIVIHFAKAVKTGAFWPMLHVDDHRIGVYQFPTVKGADLPVIAGSAIVMKKITLTVG